MINIEQFLIYNKIEYRKGGKNVSRGEINICCIFCGSGTTLKVAIRNNREAVGIDLGYSDIQTRKLQNIQKNLL